MFTFYVTRNPFNDKNSGIYKFPQSKQQIYTGERERWVIFFWINPRQGNREFYLHWRLAFNVNISHISSPRAITQWDQNLSLLVMAGTKERPAITTAQSSPFRKSLWAFCEVWSVSNTQPAVAVVCYFFVWSTARSLALSLHLPPATSCSSTIFCWNGESPQ